MSPTNPWHLARDLWPPKKPALEKFGPTEMAVAESCPARLAFERDGRFIRRVRPEAILGTAVHAAIDATSGPDYPAKHSLKERFSFLEKAFDRSLTKSLTKEEDFRNRRTSIDLDTIYRYKRGLVEVARSVTFASKTQTNQSVSQTGSIPANWTVLQEVTVSDPLGPLRGRIDKIARTDQGIIISDFKATRRTDVPDRYLNQVKLYAALWYLNYGEWPSKGEIHYLLSGLSHSVILDKEECIELLAKSRRLPEMYLTAHSIDQVATPGEVCKVCDFRPWCEPFWNERRAQDRESGILSAMLRFGIEGTVRRIERNEKIYKFTLSWNLSAAVVIAPSELFPQCAFIAEGDLVRALDSQVSGQ